MIFLEMTAPELSQAAKTAVALLPIAALEQHGAHLPVGTDTLIVTDIANRVEKELRRTVVLLPTLWMGSSHHHLGLGGTVSLSQQTYLAVLKESLESLIKSGFRRIVLLNGHGGNIVPMSSALYQLNVEFEGKDEPWIAGLTYWEIAQKELNAQKFMETSVLTHACEYETSLTLAIREDLVKLERARKPQLKVRSRFYNGAGDPPSLVSVSETFKQITKTGVMGNPRKGTRPKGEKLLKIIIPVIVEFLNDFKNWKHRP